MTPQQLKLAQAANEKRSKELDARETYLNEREALLESAPIAITVLEKTILARENQLKTINGKVSDANKAFDANIASSERGRQDILRELEVEKGHIRTEKRKITEIVERGKTLSKGNVQVEHDIADRKAYLIAQELLIANTVEAGQEHLMVLTYQTQDMEAQKRDVVGSMALLNRQKVDIEKSIEPLRERAEVLQSHYEAAAEKLKATLDGLKNDIVKASADYKRITAETEQKLRTLKAHEEEILAKRTALNIERQQIDTEKRRWQSTKGLYGI